MTRRPETKTSLSIVLLVRSLNYGGAERQLVELAKGLHRRGHSVLVAVFYQDGPLLADLRETGVPVALLAKDGRWDARFVCRLGRLLRRLRPDVVYSFLVEPSVQAVLLKPFLPGTRIVWGVRASNVELEVYGWFPRLTFRVSRLLGRFVDLVVANSWAGAAYHRAKGYPATKVTVVPNGIDLKRFRPDPEAGRRARAAWRVPEQSTVVGTVGRLDPMKDHPTFLEAAAVLSRIQQQLLFVCVGDGPAGYRFELQARAAALGLSNRVIWTGTQEDMTAVYNGLDLCCLSSAFGEGFSNVLGEAMACGVPCVATDVGDAARILDGCGVVVPPGSPSRLAEAIREGLAHVSQDRKRACRERVEREFSVDRMVDETERLLRACVNATA